MGQRYEYKNAMNTFTEKKFTAAHKEASSKIVSSIFGQMVRGIAEGRKLGEDEVRAIIDKGPYLGKEALDARLVDGLAYRDEVYEKAKAKAGKDAKLLFLGQYLERAGRPHEKGKTVAVIYGLGGVSRGKDDYDPFSGSATMGSDTVAAAFRDAVADKEVKAILFRVDSPGGSYVASDTIWRETVRAKKAGKPVIVSMGNVAGSGGYFVAMDADKIVAQPGTITGSIGVLGGKMLTTGFWDKVGLSWDEVHSGANATMWTGMKDYSPAEWARFDASLDRIYADFTTKVAEGRKLPKEKVLEIAKGRIWTGEDAKGLGLVDELGGMSTALKLAKKAAGIPDAEDVKLQVFPKAKSPLEQILGRPAREQRAPGGGGRGLARPRDDAARGAPASCAGPLGRAGDARHAPPRLGGLRHTFRVGKDTAGRRIRASESCMLRFSARSSPTDLVIGKRNTPPRPHRQVRHPRQDRAGGHGRGLQGPRPRPGPLRGHQDDRQGPGHGQQPP